MSIVLKKKNFAKSTIAFAIGVGDLTLATAAGTFSQFSTGGPFIGVLWDGDLDSPIQDSTRELVQATHNVAETFDIVRAQGGTSAREWPVGTNFAQVMSAENWDEVEAEIAAIGTTGHPHDQSVSTTDNVQFATISGLQSTATATAVFTNNASGAGGSSVGVQALGKAGGVVGLSAGDANVPNANAGVTGTVVAGGSGSGANIGVYGSDGVGGGRGVYGVSRLGGIGVYGEVDAGGSGGFGVRGIGLSDNSFGVSGESAASGGRGVRGTASGPNGIGIFASGTEFGADINNTSTGIGCRVTQGNVDYTALQVRYIMKLEPTTGTPSVPEKGMMRFNDTTGKFEGYDGIGWQAFH